MGYGLIIALALSVIVCYILFRILKSVVPLVLNGIGGIVIFWLLNYFAIMHVQIDWLTFLIAAIGGVPGVLIVLLLSFLGIPL